MGAISHLMPSIHPYMGGATGIGHGTDYTITDKETAYIGPAKALALMAVDLLYDNAEKAKEIQDKHKPIMSKAAYLAFQDDIFRKEVFDGDTGTSEDQKV